MELKDYFFLIFFLTILIVRIFLYFKPTPSPTVKGFRFHHWMLGIILITVAMVFKSLELYAVGLGLFIDELTYILIKGKNHKDNYSIISIAGTALFVIIIFIFRDYFLKVF